MKKLSFVFLISVLLFACNEPGNSLRFSQKELVLKDDTCQTNECTMVSLRYPIFEGTASDTLNQTALNMIGSSYFNDTFVVLSPQKTAETFINTYREFKEETPDYPSITWVLDKDLRVDTILSNVITLRYDESSFSGGAHGNYYTLFNHFQLQPFKILWLADFLNQASDTFQVIKIAESVFREQHKLNAYADLSEDFFFENGIFKLNDNFHFTQKGIEFHFNIYEIQPYAAGDYDLLIPFDKVAHLLNKELLKGI